MVLREGLGLEQYGLVDAKAAKMQRLGQSSGECCCSPSCPHFSSGLIREGR